MSEMKNILGGINGRLDIEKEKKNSVLEDIAMETIQYETHREKNLMKRASVNYGTTSRNLIYVWSP